MRVRDSIGLNLSPFILRLVLAITFVWAGAGKLLPVHQFTPDQAAALANMGAIEAPASAPVNPAPQAGLPAVTDAAPKYLPEQFPEGVQARRVLGLALMLDHAAHPGFTDDGVEPRPIWPPDLAAGKRPVYLAYAVAITELVGGMALLLGLFTRLGVLGLVFVMLGAIWLDQIGPAVQSGNALFGFLPPHGAFDVDAQGKPVWMPLLWQLSLLGASSAVFFLGAGGLSLDRIVFGGPQKRTVVQTSEKHD
ncbi:MAG: DoxX family protein [Leptolyngbya sp. PLA3]|nr:MAG: DoxX family protein [Cyanobacteria bacterium CYA]MCE7967250.1 DoxX family protein [Leptolyngbya sp. PL-A3]